ncbi:MAG: hypothetical protein ABEN55_13895, partial [Bradymonadaceae bacterium]
MPLSRPRGRRSRRSLSALVAAAVCVLAVLGTPDPIRAESPNDGDEETAPSETEKPGDDEPSKSRSDDPGAASSERDVEPPENGRASPSAEKLLEEASEIVAKVARIRGLDPTAKIDKGVKTREELRKILVEKLAEEQSKQQMRQEAAVFRKLGLIPEDFQYRKVIL